MERPIIMGKTIDDINKGLKAVERFQNIMLKPQTIEAFNRLSDSVERLSGQFMSLGDAILKQNKEVSESIKEAKKQAEDLRKELEALNTTSSKSQAVFERMDRSNKAVENLTLILSAMTFVMVAIGMYPIVKDILCSNSTCNYIWVFVGSGGVAMGVLITIVWILNRQKIQQRENGG